MPGIFPMKVIKVGNSAQSRVAQACDRCRSKKIRCDGVRPTCSQCATVGFECRTSDKLSRRAFPRGYTESLEERVRQLETEVRELKDLLDEKDEKMDILCATLGNPQRRPSAASQPPPQPPDQSKASPAPSAKEDLFRIQGSPLLLGAENSESYFMGPSSGRSFVLSFKRKLQELGKPCNDFNPDAFLHVQGCAPLTLEDDDVPRASPGLPPRIFSDRCVNVFFQEVAPLFPVLHKPTFLRVYEEFVANPKKVRGHHKLAQLYLVFSIAGVASESPDYQQVAACERQWDQAVQSLVLENTMSTLQCLILALLYCTIRADNKRVQHFKGLAVGLSHRLGLHQSQKRFSFGVLTLETRKKVFWTLYTLDCFTAATLGLPKLLREDDVRTEYPADADDEYITEKGFQPTLPGEFTRLSSALALFRASRILARILETNYPTLSSYELSLQRLGAFEEELDAWYDDLPAHLRLTFSQDKPSTETTGSRSPILALAYYHIRTLIHRPAVGSSLGCKAAPALLSIVSSSKRIIQVVQLLEERNMSFAFCLNKFDLLALCGLTLLYQVVDLKPDGKLTRDVARLVNITAKALGKAEAPGCVEFSRVAAALAPVDKGHGAPSSSRGPMPAPARRSSSSSRAEGREKPSHPRQPEKLRRPTASTNPPEAALSPRSQQSLDSLTSEPSSSVQHQGQQRLSMPTAGTGTQRACPSRAIPDLNCLALNSTPYPTGPPSLSAGHDGRMQTLGGSSTSPSRHVAHGGDSASKLSAMSNAEWEALLGSMDGGLNNVYDAIYGGAILRDEAPVQARPFSPDSWVMTRISAANFARDDDAPGPQSVLSLSDESLSPGEEAPSSDLGLSVASAELNRLHVAEAFGYEFEGFPW
ncbi:uncharacterized protein UV8b_04607 [Ustilaginoidea virens]|uniref:Zn(2)-C6 fungal-type domain-containing protein n=1 Tax=Ustilaginoidea virens TaxID=1159556 RepID=A0A063BZ99_USTVR|nr:uncharacterized protein UV8b_04607 [Ustilaginoidea virens]QUC20366.1 hypothetical protein UV8b_04607 [Ustilaginoidea virens]GAO14706.1 hypothetical protein UVI_02028800 [Ustilaginoidea virens]